MSNTYKSPWICKGYKQDPHPEEEVEQGEICPICERTEEQNKTSTPLPLAKLIPVINTVLGLAAAFLLFKLITNQFSQASYKNPSYGISVKYPKSWELRKPSKNYPPSALTGTKDLFQLVPPSQSGTSYLENILVKIEQVESNSFLDGYVDSQVARINQIGTYEIDSDQNISVNKQSAREIIYSGNNDEYDLTRRRIILTPKAQDDYFILVTYTSDSNDYEQYLPEVEQVVNSINLL